MVAHITEDIIAGLETVEEIPLLGEAFLNSTCLQNTDWRIWYELSIAASQL